MISQHIIVTALFYHTVLFVAFMIIFVLFPPRKIHRYITKQQMIVMFFTLEWRMLLAIRESVVKTFKHVGEKWKR